MQVSKSDIIYVLYDPFDIKYGDNIHRFSAYGEFEIEYDREIKVRCVSNPDGYEFEDDSPLIC